jgi:hypothetical protein
LQAPTVHRCRAASDRRPERTPFPRHHPRNAFTTRSITNKPRQQERLDHPARQRPGNRPISV